MGMNTISQSGHTAYGIKEFVVDTPEDVKKLPVDIPMGSAALVLSNGHVCVLGSQDNWVDLMEEE